jgi:ligand-binding sensor domain-containing protein/signal transduction histidine kinase
MLTRSLWRVTAGLSIALIVAALPGRAVDPNQPATSYLRTSFTVEDGLSSNVVNAILQTRNGFLWIGTDAGLNRFDGRHFTPIYFRGPKGTPQGIVSALAEGPNGDLWMGTDAGLVRIPGQALDRCERSSMVFYHPGAGLSDEVRWLHFSRAGVLWIGTEAGLFRLDGDRFETVIPQVSISRIEESADGHLLVVSGNGFIELDRMRVVEHPGLAEKLGIDSHRIYHVFQDRKGAVWFCTISGLARQANGSIERLQPYGPGGHGVLRVYEDPEGNLWVAGSTSAQSTGGIFRVSGTKLESLAPNIQVRAISADREGNLWLGTNGEGLLRFKDRPIRLFTKPDGLPNNVPMTVLSKRDGSVWVGNNCGGLSVFNGERFKTYDEKDGLANSCVWALAEGKDGELWVGTWGGGIFRFAENHFEQFTNARQGLANDIVRAIMVARDGSLWIATDGGLSHMADGRFQNYSTADGLSSNHILNVYQDHHGGIWVGTSGGINRMTGERFTPVLSAHEIFDPRFISLGEDSSGDLYAISEPTGVDRIEGNQLVEVNHDLDLLSMVISHPGELWFSGGKGIFRFSEAAFRQSHSPENPSDYAWFGKADGMATTQCSIGTPNMAMAADGKLWVATVQGLAMLNLPHLHFDDAKPVIFVEEVTVGRESQLPDRELVLPPGTHHVEIRFDSISLASPERIRFQYRMEGVDPVWLDADNAHTAVYSNLPVGTHAFRLRACNSAGVWDRSGISFPVTQKPYFYETTWFRLVALTAFVVILTAAYRFRLRQIHAQINARLDERVLERTRVARELHDTLLQSFQGILMYFQAGINKLPEAPTEEGTAEARETLHNAMRKAANAIVEGRETIKGLRLSVVETNDLALAIRTFGEELAAGDSATFYVQAEGMSRKLHPIIRDEVYRIAGEAMRNAFRHAGAKQIGVEIHYDDRRLRVCVRDDGKGIDPKLLNDDKREGHFGLRGMKERAMLIGGKLAVQSAVDAGTEVELTVPAGRAYASPHKGPRTWLAEKFRAVLYGRGTEKNT